MIDGPDATQWRQAGTIFHELVALDPDERSARLSTMISDPGLRSAVEALLAGDAVADERLPQPGFGILQRWDSADPLQLVGRIISHFRVGEPLASGGMGIVYRADDLQLRRPVALKFLLPYSQLTDSSKERFLREARAAGALDHPNLCPIYEIGESSAGLFLAMPLYGGETLRDRLARDGTIAVNDALAIASQIAAGLHSAHAAGIIHRDIKPGNIMLLPDGTAKILDFGLAKERAEPTVSRVLLGTVSYMSPEQIQGDPVDARADLWALGLMLYEMLSGVRPFRGEHDATILHAIVHTNPRPLSELLPNVARDVEALVLTLLAKNPDARYAGADDLAEAIGAIRGGARSIRRSPRALRRMRWLAITSGVGLLALSATAYVGFGRGRSLVATGAIAESDPLVVADFDVAGTDTALGPILARTFAGNLGQSRFVSVMQRGRVESALLRMRRAPGTRLTPALAREVAQREGARAVVQGDLARLGAGYLVTIRLVAATTGDELTSVQQTAARPESDLLPTLDKLGTSLRSKIGESLRDVRANPPLRKWTTSSLEALRLFVASSPSRQTLAEYMVRMRQVVALDSTFAYAWLMIGNSLSSNRYRTDARDSAYMMMYRFRDRLTPFERAQATAFYWRLVGLDRLQAFEAYENLLATADSSKWQAVLNLAAYLIEARQFNRAETLVHRYESSVGGRGWTTLVDAQVGQGRFGVADSLLASEERSRRDSVGVFRVRVRVALAALELDSAASLATRRLLPASRFSEGHVALAGIARARGRLAEAHQLDAKIDSLRAELLRVTNFEPAFDRALTLASEELWLRRDPTRALAVLDNSFAAHPARSLGHIQDRIDAVNAAALYAAAGRPDRARSILDAIILTSDAISLRATHELRLTAAAEIALAEHRPRDAMGLFRQSDLAADGLPATRCAVCILPGLARASERAGWTDSARVYWERYVMTPSLDRLATDQWFLATAYRRLGALYAASGDRAMADEFQAKLSKLRKNADPDLLALERPRRQLYLSERW